MSEWAKDQWRTTRSGLGRVIVINCTLRLNSVYIGRLCQSSYNYGIKWAVTYCVEPEHRTRTRVGLPGEVVI